MITGLNPIMLLFDISNVQVKLHLKLISNKVATTNVILTACH